MIMMVYVVGIRHFPRDNRVENSGKFAKTLENSRRALPHAVTENAYGAGSFRITTFGVV